MFSLRGRSALRYIVWLQTALFVLPANANRRVHLMASSEVKEVAPKEERLGVPLMNPSASGVIQEHHTLTVLVGLQV